MKKKKGPTPVTTMRIPPELRARVKARANKEKRSESMMTRILIERGLIRSAAADQLSATGADDAQVTLD